MLIFAHQNACWHSHCNPYFLTRLFPTPVLLRQVSSDETERLIKMEEVLHGRVIGQEEAVSAIARAIRRARVGLKNPSRPIASFIFAGELLGGLGKGRARRDEDDGRCGGYVGGQRRAMGGAGGPRR